MELGTATHGTWVAMLEQVEVEPHLPSSIPVPSVADIATVDTSDADGSGRAEPRNELERIARPVAYGSVVVSGINTNVHGTMLAVARDGVAWSVESAEGCFVLKAKTTSYRPGI